MHSLFELQRREIRPDLVELPEPSFQTRVFKLKWAVWGCLVVSGIAHLWLLATLGGMVAPTDRAIPTLTIDSAFREMMSASPIETAEMQSPAIFTSRLTAAQQAAEIVIARADQPEVEKPTRNVQEPEVVATADTQQSGASSPDPKRLQQTTVQQTTTQKPPVTPPSKSATIVAANNSTTQTPAAKSKTRPAATNSLASYTISARPSFLKRSRVGGLGETCQSRSLGTKLAWVENMKTASTVAERESKMMFLIHVSGNFAREEFT